MPAGKPGDLWMTDLEITAKICRCLILTPQPKGHKPLDMFTIVAHPTVCAAVAGSSS